jgi:uncharacterized membrane protein YsdA (DUF1294 family)
VAFIGGFWGLIAGGEAFHHKTSKSPFIEIACLSAIL